MGICYLLASISGTAIVSTPWPCFLGWRSPANTEYHFSDDMDAMGKLTWNPMPTRNWRAWETVSSAYQCTKDWLWKWAVKRGCLWRRLDFLLLVPCYRGNLFILPGLLRILSSVHALRDFAYILVLSFWVCKWGQWCFMFLCIWMWRYTLGMSGLYVYTFFDLIWGFLRCCFLAFTEWLKMKDAHR